MGPTAEYRDRVRYELASERTRMAWFAAFALLALGVWLLAFYFDIFLLRIACIGIASACASAAAEARRTVKQLRDVLREIEKQG